MENKKQMREISILKNFKNILYFFIKNIFTIFITNIIITYLLFDLLRIFISNKFMFGINNYIFNSNNIFYILTFLCIISLKFIIYGNKYENSQKDTSTPIEMYFAYTFDRFISSFLTLFIFLIIILSSSILLIGIYFFFIYSFSIYYTSAKNPITNSTIKRYFLTNSFDRINDITFKKRKRVFFYNLVVFLATIFLYIIIPKNLYFNDIYISMFVKFIIMDIYIIHIIIFGHFLDKIEEDNFDYLKSKEKLKGGAVAKGGATAGKYFDPQAKNAKNKIK